MACKTAKGGRLALLVPSGASFYMASAFLTSFDPSSQGHYHPLPLNLPPSGGNGSRAYNPPRTAGLGSETASDSLGILAEGWPLPL